MECTELSKCIWNLKNQGMTSIVKWRIVKKVNSKVPPNYCKLCLTEKFFIIKSLIIKSFIIKLSLLINAGIKISCYYAM